MSDIGLQRVREGRVLYRDTEAHAALVARTLGLDRDAWSRVLDGYADRWRPDRDDDAGRLAALTAAFAHVTTLHAPLPAHDPHAPCPMCGDATTFAVARAVPGSSRAAVFARCAECGHGALVAGEAPASIYDADYYRGRDEGGAGYDDYDGEQRYREAKGALLLDRIATHTGHAPSSMLEVGSGFGYTRKAAALRGIRHAGVDVNPAAARVARARYGFHTFTGTLDDAIAAGAIARGAFDLVLYQFVLEHLADPRAAAATAATTLRFGGAFAALVPSMEALECDVFGGAYRSLRHDHLHLFSRRSLARCMEAAGLRVVAVESQCAVHVLRGFLTEDALAALYASGRGPDLLGVGVRDAP